MTSTNEIEKVETSPCSVILKTDGRGYLRLPLQKRQKLLEEYDRSGMTAAAFAKWCGVKYTTLCGWLQRRGKESPVGSRDKPMQWAEAVVTPGDKAWSGCVILHVGTVRLEVTNAKMAIEILKELGVKTC